ncbi:DUF4097 family beta strand repeat protein [candidate division WOR-3 bacterium]|nr:DUF4097 family beta strand repeat protein [candidate division WOR-3 bacterium]
MKKILISTIICMLCILVFAANTYKKGGYFYETDEIEFKGIKNITATTSNGDITVRSWDKNFVKVIYKKRAKKESELKNAEIITDKSGNKLIVKSVFKKMIVKNLSVSFDIFIPKNVRVSSVKTSNGDISVNGSNGNIQTGSSNGDIELKNIDGIIDAATSNGDIKILKSLSINSVKTSNGDIEIHVRNIKNNSEIKSSNGSIKVFIKNKPDINVILKSSTGKVSINGFNPDYKVNKKNYIEAIIGKPKFNVMIKTSNGKASLNKE